MKLFSNTYRYFWILVLATYSYLNSLFLEVFAFYHIEEPQWLIWIGFLLIVTCVWEGNRWMERWINTGSSTSNPLLQQFLFSLVFAALCGWLVPTILQQFSSSHDQPSRQVELKLAIVFSLRVNLFLQCIHAFLFFVQRARAKEKEAESLKVAVAHADLQRIKSQINPHFLFNNLNVLSSLVMTGSKDANTFVESFSTVYRQLLAASDKDLITLEEETNILKPYIFLLEKRFGDALQLHVRIPDNCMPFKLVPTSLQLLVENAIKHNVVSVQKNLHIYIIADASVQQIKVQNLVEPKLQTESSGGKGLTTIAERYKYATGKTISIKSTPEAFEVVLPLIR